MKTRTIVATGVTLAWAGFVTYLVASDWETFKGLEFNAKGDFLSGFVAPAVFFWLILGYFQQGEELQQNTRALEMQYQELQHAVQEYRVMAEANKRHVELIEAEHEAQLERERRLSQPDLRHLGGRSSFLGNTQRQYELKIANQGHSISEVRISCSDPKIFIGPKTLPFFDKDGRQDFMFAVEDETEVESSLIFSYLDGRGIEGQAILYFKFLSGNTWVFHSLEDMLRARTT